MSAKRCKDLKVILGDHDVTKQEDSQKERKVCGIQVHPRYNSVFKDVALVELCEPVTFNHAIQPIKFATKGLYISLARLVTSILYERIGTWQSVKKHARHCLLMLLNKKNLASTERILFI